MVRKVAGPAVMRAVAHPLRLAILTEMWDGVSYGDITGGDGVCRFERGPRGGIVRHNF